MLRSTKLISAAVVTGALALGGSAFTAGNTLPTSRIGYGESTVTGATIQSISYTLDPSDGSKLGSVVFIATNQFPNSGTGNGPDPIAQMTLKNAGTLVESDTCTVNTESSTTTITCVAAGSPLISSFNQTGLTVIGGQPVA